MFFLLCSLIVGLFLVLFLKLASVFLSESDLVSRESLSSYECGFEHNNVSRIPFSLRYFFLTLLFLLFDLEVVLLLICPFLLLSTTKSMITIFIVVFLLVLFFSLIYEWSDGTLEWLNYLIEFCHFLGGLSIHVV